jgi:tetratricopeptide (TPR) repeat protein
MDGLIKLIGTLKPSELKWVDQYYELRSGNEGEKRGKLFRMVSSGEKYTNEEAMKVLYGKKSPSAFSQLKMRLKNDLLDLLALQHSQSNKSGQSKAVFECRKAINHGGVLIDRGLYQEAVPILLKASALARKNELFAESILIDELMRSRIPDSVGVIGNGEKDETDGINIQSLKMLLTENIKENAVSLDTTRAAKSSHKAVEEVSSGKVCEPEKLDDSKEKLEQLKGDYDSTKLSGVGFFYYLSAVKFCIYENDYERALDYAYRLLEMLDGNETLSTPSNIAKVNMEIAIILVNLDRVEYAKEYSKVAITIMKEREILSMSALEGLFFAYFNTDRLDEAEAVRKEVMALPMVKESELMSSKWNYLEAGIQFRAGNFKEVLKLLRQNNRFLRKDNEWFLGYYVLEMMTMVEVEDLDFFYYKAEAFKKVIYRYKGKEIGAAYNRAVLAERIFRTMIKCDFEFNKVADKEARKIHLLTEGKGEQYRNPSGYEIIRFDEWLLSKVAVKKLA